MQFCGIDTTAAAIVEKAIKEIDVQTLAQLKKSGEPFQLIDVREPYEFAISQIDGELIPLKSVSDFAHKIQKDRKVIVHCRSGVRSAKAIRELEEKFGFDNLYNLKGGILAWAKEIDEGVAVY